MRIMEKIALSGVIILQPQQLKWGWCWGGKLALARVRKTRLTQRLVQTACLRTHDSQVYNAVPV